MYGRSRGECRQMGYTWAGIGDGKDNSGIFCFEAVPTVWAEPVADAGAPDASSADAR